MINAVWKASFDCEPSHAVLKLRSVGDGGSAVEAQHLSFLQTHTQLPVPQVYHEDSTGQHIPFACLVLEMLPGRNLDAVQLTVSDRERIDRQLAHALLELHSHTRETFGSLGEGTGASRWADVFVPRMRDMRTEMVPRVPGHVLQNIDHAIEIAPEIFSDQGTPTLVHGDIWAGNILVAQSDDGWHLSGLIDPGVQYADVEMELAYLEVFHSVGPTFFEVYTLQRPLRPGYETRRLFYWLQTHMIHVWLFGDAHYHRMTERIAVEIAGLQGSDRRNSPTRGLHTSFSLTCHK